jgi:hypothetical protein
MDTDPGGFLITLLSFNENDREFPRINADRVRSILKERSPIIDPFLPGGDRPPPSRRDDVAQVDAEDRLSGR